MVIAKNGIDIPDPERVEFKFKEEKTPIDCRFYTNGGAI